MTEVTFKIQTPTVPNFVRVIIPEAASRSQGFREAPMISVKELSVEQLECLADDWRNELFKNAEKQRVQGK